MTEDHQTEDETNGTPFDAAVQSVQDAVSSRRGFLAGSAAAGLGALTFGTSGVAAQQSNGNGDPKGNSDGKANENAVSDVDVLNYALTLEHLEDAFYQHNLKSLGGYYSLETIVTADMLDHLPYVAREPIYGHLTDIGEHEAAHVDTIVSVIEQLGGTPVEKAEYEFGTMKANNPSAFYKTAMALENTGVQAYLGALSLIDDPDLQTAAGTIATVEARHASYLNHLNGADPFPNAFDEPKSMDEVLEIASQFIV
ncbi:ferritin-like domain-containing protein [Halogeometricum limi]|uniref:Tat (Twin-arginine translocation) pathway signal sequence n=1 Tax=Halogeometricum limi TaxID=555875 RepID=A0A1I6H9T8_9EURY|nr:ferritin-like domain-containing protein [Halogeometricum limi]SFR51289.1 Tat (twin-arginine translocation) pathway signal sequence [Halogeometricum limi]